MKYRLEWGEWSQVSNENKLKFWQIVEPTAQAEKVLTMALYIPDIIKMMEFLGNEWLEINKDKYTYEVYKNEIICDTLWEKCLKKLNLN